MLDVYKRLAKRLDELPNGYPATDSGVELKILQKVFSPEDAEMALRIKPFPETAEDIAGRLEMSVSEIRSILDTMVKRGQIGCFKMFGQQVYMLFPFVVGIYEFQVYRLDKELVELYEEYLPSLMKTLGGYEPAIARTVPINTKIEAKTQVHRYEDVREIIEKAKSFLLMECICKQERLIAGHPCNFPLEVCLMISKEEDAYDYFSWGGRTISKEDALEVLENAEKEGLVHNAFHNAKKGHYSICNCCPCCCGILRGGKEFKAPHLLAKCNFVAHIDQDSCNECGVCAEERCPMDAIIEEDGVYKVLSDTCIGCGVCTVTCPTESISLIRKPELEQNIPPDNIIDASFNRAANRGIDLS